MDKRIDALVDLGRKLRDRSYHFVTPTPSTHASVIRRPFRPGDATLADVFGWSRLFLESALPTEMLTALDRAEGLSHQNGLLKSEIRYSSLGTQLFAHSSFPTQGESDVFFGPDTYRFAHALTALAREFPSFAPRRIVDIGAGSGAGGLAAAQLFSATNLVLCDINEKALHFARANTLLNDFHADIILSDGLRGVPGRADLIISNPPYLVDAHRRAYRHGGGDWGFDLSLRFVGEALERLAPGGKLLLYTGAPIVHDVDLFREALRERLGHRRWRYEEIDPDVFGEELETPPYDQTDRIAVVCVLVEASK